MRSGAVAVLIAVVRGWLTITTSTGIAFHTIIRYGQQHAIAAVVRGWLTITTSTGIAFHTIIRYGQQHAIATQQPLEALLMVVSSLSTILSRRKTIEANHTGTTTTKTTASLSVLNTITP
ncbi:hypothetical protein C451_19998 [Halococcus thailandensis JCM 13552]|uniref:Uncharacterized protein n=1 Tax=Halococcus thailandensis JCM 13552 TaxID=1227457 RepID=M0MSU4_9EURY|nr:hypothetical protein C451_19998 [Halococcus thailandensis JCM 13552]